MNSNKRQLQIL